MLLTLAVGADGVVQNVVELDCLGIGPVLDEELDGLQDVEPLGLLVHFEVVDGVLVLSLREHQAHRHHLLKVEVFLGLWNDDVLEHLDRLVDWEEGVEVVRAFL